MSGKTGTQPTVPVVNVPWKDSVPVQRLAAFLYGLDSVSKDAQAWSNTFVMVETAQEAARVLERVHDRHLGTAQQAADSYAVLCGSSSDDSSDPLSVVSMLQVLTHQAVSYSLDVAMTVKYTADEARLTVKKSFKRAIPAGGVGGGAGKNPQWN